MDKRHTTPTATRTTTVNTDQEETRAAVHHRRKPPMRVVTKGWATLVERNVDIDDLRRERDHAEG